MTGLQIKHMEIQQEVIEVSEIRPLETQEGIGAENMSPNDYVGFVNDKETFLAFVEKLRRDRESSVKAEKEKPSDSYGPRALGWENLTIKDFLEAATRWAKDTADMFPEQPDWRAFAYFLLAGKEYE